MVVGGGWACVRLRPLLSGIGACDAGRWLRAGDDVGWGAAGGWRRMEVGFL